MLLAVTLGRSGDGHCRTRRRYPIRCLRLTNSSVILGLTRNASLHVRDSVRSYAPYTQKTLAFRVLFYKECEQIASAYAWSGPSRVRHRGGRSLPRLRVPGGVVCMYS